MSSDSEEGFVHRPDDSGDPDDGGDSGPGDVARPGDDPRETAPTVAGGASADGDDHDANGGIGGADAASEPGFGRRGWLLVAAVVFATLVVPGVIYLRPATPADAGLPFLAAMLVLPLVPAVLLGLVAVWSMSSSARSGRR